jgi:hypothetical protein
MLPTAHDIRIATDSRTPEFFLECISSSIGSYLDTRATKSSNRESKSLRMGERFDFL